MINYPFIDSLDKIHYAIFAYNATQTSDRILGGFYTSIYEKKNYL